MNKAVKIPARLFVLILLIMPGIAFAAGSGMPWESPMDQILNSLTGPWLRFGSVLAILSAGLLYALGEVRGLLEKCIQICLGLSVACAATGWGLSFFGFAGGLNF